MEQAVATLRLRGFSLIEAMIAVVIVGVLATLAVPGLLSTRVRDQVVESAQLIDVAKKQVNAFWTANGTMPRNNDEAGLPIPEKMVANYVKSVTVTDGVIEVVFGNNASGAIANKRLILRPAVIDDTPAVPIAWVCGHAHVPANMTARGEDRTDLPSATLPVNCR